MGPWQRSEWTLVNDEGYGNRRKRSTIHSVTPGRTEGVVLFTLLDVKDLDYIREGQDVEDLWWLETERLQ